MRTKLLFYFITLLGVISANSQATETYQIDWKWNTNGDSANKTIEVGDTIEWVWADNLSHDVVSKSGSTETFDSELQSGNGYVFSHTFNNVGITNYECSPHSFNMFGTITVVAEGTLDIKNDVFIDFKISPNPAENFIKIQFSESITQVKVQVYDVLGKQIYAETSTLSTLIDVSTWGKGIYLLKVSSEEKTTTKKFIKQ